ncbi:Conserved hypothetical protein [Thermococcus gammatolerans EJ3]|uniref:PKD domain-containing protein n=1 Tax=Thermococcus gammatolerans (strain DSM 15229 / JCM 11827 / EJ3) TaxID=593117 RepID=C5A1I2_THEGJ|nr:Conserved hypothetical protein [Thermococcus gammatolerans EJ3]
MILLGSMIPPNAISFVPAFSSGKPPDLEVHEAGYRVGNEGVEVFSTVRNRGGSADSFNVTFNFVPPVTPPVPRRISFVWENTSELIANSAKVTSGAYVRGGSVVLNADDGYLIYELPFELNFFGIPVRNISVSTNGYVELMVEYEDTLSAGDYGVWDLLSEERRDFIAALDDDLETEDGYLLVAELEDGVLLEWFGATYEDYDSGNYPVNFQLLIFSNGTIVWSYRLLRASYLSGKAGYFSRVALESTEVSPMEGRSYIVNVPSVTPSSLKVQVSGLEGGGSLNLSVESPISEGYVRITADREELLGDEDYSDNFAELWFWPGDYWIEDASVSNITPGEVVEINFTVKTSSKHPENVEVRLLKNGKVEEARLLSGFSNGTLDGKLFWLAQGGNYTLTLEIMAMGDTNGSNNALLLGEYSFPLPNFRIANYSVEIPNCLGASADIAVNVTNDGGLNWSGVDVRALILYDDNRSSSSWAGIPFLPAGESFEVHLSPGVLAGNVTGVLIEVDPYDTVEESNEGDNSVEVPYTLAVKLPDFTVERIDVPGNVSSGNRYYVNASLRNLGGCYAGSVRVNLYEDGSYESSAYVEINGTARVSLRWWPSRVGWVNLTVRVDPYDSVDERREDNNELTERVFVNGPDVTIKSVKLVDFDGIAGSPATFNVTIKNLGEGFTSGFYVALYGGIGTETIYVPGGLSAGEERNVTITTYANGGNVTLRFVADAYNWIVESNESNNEFLYALSVPRPNFLVESITMPENTVGYVPVNVTIRNAGSPYNGTTFPLRIKLSLGGNSEYWYVYDFLDRNGTKTLSGRITLQAPGDVANATIFAKVNETSKSDNWLAVNVTTGYPDLVLGIQAPELSAGEYKAVTYTVRNVGNVTLMADHMTLEYGIKHENGENVTGWRWLWNIVLEPNSTLEVPLYFTFNGGRNVLFGTIDEGDRWREQDEGNNNASLVLDLGKPDFAIANYSIPGEVLNGTAYLYRSYGIKVNVTNLGEDFRGSLWIQLLADGRSAYSVWVSKLRSGEGREVTLYYRPEPGKHNLTIALDLRNDWIEAREDNNNVSLSTDRFGIPELVPVGITWEPYNFTSGERVTFSAFIKNLGHSFEKSFAVRIELWNGSEMLSSGWAYSPSGYAMGSNETKEFRWTWYNAKPGNLTVKVVADYYDAIEEQNESNNNFTAEIGSVGTPDFELSNLSVGELAYGKAVDINVTLRNLGEAIYRPFSVLFNISGELHYVMVYGMAANETRTVTYRWYVNQVGDVKVSVKADPSDLIVEADETNNWVSGSYFIEIPELWIESYSWVKDDLARGYVTFRVNVTNSGGSTYRGFYLAMYIDGTRKVRKWVPSLLSGETREEALSWRVDAGGRHEVLLVVDDGNLIPETSEDNNAASTNVTVELPDIEVENVSVPEMHANAVFTVNVTLRNSGTEDIERPFLVAVFQDERYLGGTFVSSLPAGNSSTVGIAIRPYPGDSLLRVVADHYGSIVETNETNNEFSKGIHVKAPDIKVVSLLPRVPEYSGEEVNATVIIRNVGDYGTGTFYVALRHDGKTLGGGYVRNLLPGEERNVSITWKADAGNYNLTAIADPYGAIREWDEDNNALMVEVSVPAPDLRVVGLEHSDVIAGEYMDFTVVIENAGERTLLPFYVGIYANSTLVAVRRIHGLSPGRNLTLNFENAWKARYGQYVLRAVVDPYDEVSEVAENNNEVEVPVFITDERAPVLRLAYPGNRSFTNEPLVGALLSDEGSGMDYSRTEMKLYLNGAQVEGSPAVSWGWLVFQNSTPLEDGNYTVLIRAVDRAGNSKEYRWWFVLDRKAPEIATNVLNGTLYNGSFMPEINVTDSNLKEYQVTINGRDYRGEIIRTDGSYLLEVVALDRAGNEARYSAWFRVNGIPRPPSGLVVNVSDNYVTLSWLQSGDSDIAGYYVYRDGVRLNDEPIEVTTFRDIFTGSLNYSVTAVDYMGFESEPAFIFPARLMITAGKVYVGYPMRVYVDVENLDGYANGSLSLQLVDVFGNVIERLEKGVELPEGSIRESFDVTVPSGLGSLKAVLTVGDSSTQALLPVESVEVEPPEITVGKLQTGLPGLVEVRIKNYGDAELDTSKAVLRLGNVSGEPLEPLPVIGPGEEAVIPYRLVPRERGTYELMFSLGSLVSTREVEVRDPVASPVMVLTENFVRGGEGRIHVTFRNTGSAPLRVTGVEVLGMRRDLSVFLPPNLSVVTSFNYVVPANVSEITLNATVFTDVGTFKRSVTAGTEKPPYNANVTVRPAFEVDDTVLIEGFAYNESGLLANVPVKVGIVRGDFVREYLVITDGSGHFRMSFTPFRNEAGHFVVSATHPSVLVPERDAEFDIVGLTLNPDVYQLIVTKEFSGEIEVELTNHWKASNVTVEVSAPSAYNVSVPERIELKEGINRIKIGLSSENAVNRSIVITFRTTQLGMEVEKNLTIEVSVLPPAPRIEVEPRSLQVGVLTNETKGVTLNIKNAGFETLRNVSVNSPIEWVRVVSNFTELKAGKEASIGLYIAPPDNATGTFEGRLRISSANYPDVYIPIRVTVTPNATGLVRITVMDPNATRLEGAEVTLYNEYAHFEGTTDENGTVVFGGVPMGDYTLIVGEKSHYTSTKRITVEPGVEKNVTVVLMPSILEIKWEVVPVTIQDVYVIKHEIGYTTYVPAPEIKTYGGDLEVYVDYKKLAELGVLEFRGQLIVRNTHRYVSVFNVTFNSGGSHYIDVEFLVNRIDELKPGESVVVPYVVRVYYQRSPPINPCLHETKVFTLRAGVVCVEEAGKITLRAEKVHKIIVKPTCDGCWKSLLNIGAHVVFDTLIDKMGDVFKNNEIMKESGEKIVQNLQELYDAYYEMSMNPTDETRKNFAKKYQEVRANFLKILKSASVKYGEKYLEDYLSAKGINFELITDENGTVVGFILPPMDGYMYPSVMSVVRVENGNVQVDWGKAKDLVDKLSGGVISELEEAAKNLPAVKVLDLIIKLVDDYTPKIAEAGMNCAICLWGNNCTPPNLGDPKPIQLIRSGYLLGSGYGDGLAGGGGGGAGGETSVGRFTCEGLPTIKKSGSSGSSSTRAKACPSCFGLSSLPGERKVCVNVPLRDTPQLPAQEGGETPTNKLHMCVDLVITVEQRLAFERQAFRASLKFTNTNSNYSLKDVNVSVVFFDENAKEVTDRFFLRLDESEGIVNGDLPPREAARFRWLIIPKVGAAEKFRTRYYVIANVTGKVGNTTLVFETWPAVIEVEPVPQLELDYVIPRKVYGDDPYTPEVEPPVPFVFGVRVRNVGYGEARNLRIASAQPRIERSNYPGVYIDFRIIGTLLDGRKVPNSLNINFGNIGPGESSTAAWIMTAEVTGDFVYYNATFKHSDELGGEETSLIRAVRTHFLLRTFNDTANDDGMLDFLVDDDGDGIPELIIDSDGGDYTVLVLNFTEEYGTGFRKIVPSVRSPDWVYLAVPVWGYTMARRSDGEEPITQWIENGTLHILDLGTPEFYILKANRPPVPVVKVIGEPIVNSTVLLDGSLSYDPDGRIVRYAWIIGNESFEGPAVNYTFTEPGNHTVVLTVWDDENESASVREVVYVYTSAMFKVTGEISPEWGVVPFTLSLTVNVTNTGDLAGVYNATLRLDDEPIAWRTVEVGPGETANVTFRVEITEAGKHTLSVDGETWTVTAYRNVSREELEAFTYSRDFGDGYTRWEEFRQDFVDWATGVLANVSLPETGLEVVLNESVSEWTLINYTESLTTERGWINATYERNATIVGITGFNYTTVRITQRVTLFANTSKKADTTPPEISVSPASGVYEEIPVLNVTVIDESNVTVWVEVEGARENMTLVEKSGNLSLWSGRPSLSVGNNTVVVVAEDVFGNCANETLWLYLNPRAPLITIESPAEKIYNSRTIWFNYTVLDDDLLGVKAYLDGRLISTEPVAGLNLSLDYGGHNFTVVAWDVSNNVSETVTFRVNEPPTVNFTWDAEHLTVAFSALADDPDGIAGYLWNFGDGSTSDETNPTHVYAAGGVYTVTLTVWDAYNLSATASKTIEVFALVNESREESYTFTKDFGFYNTISWEPFKGEFEAWKEEVLRSINVLVDEFEEVWEIETGNWSIVSRAESLVPGSGYGWINATYLRVVRVRGIIDHNETLLRITQSVALFANASNLRDTEPPSLKILYPENKTYDHNVTEIRVEASDSSGVQVVFAEVDGRCVSLHQADGIWRAAVNLGDGHHRIVVTAVDIWDNTRSKVVEFTVNTSVEVIYINGTEVIRVPGEIKSRVKFKGDALRVILGLNGTRTYFHFPPGGRVVIDECLKETPWLVISNGMKMVGISIKEGERREGAFKHRTKTIRAEVTGEGYAVLLMPLEGMRVVSVTLEKDGITYKLSEGMGSVGYYGALGEYVYVLIHGASTVHIQLESPARRFDPYWAWFLLGMKWEKRYLELKDTFEAIEPRAEEEKILEKALALHRKAEEYYLFGKMYCLHDPMRYAIYMRRAYFLEKRALKLLMRAL